MADTVVSSGSTGTVALGDGDTMEVESGGTSLDSTIGNGDSTIGNGGSATISGDAIGSLILSGGYQDVDTGGTAEGSVVSSGGEEDVEGVTNNTTIYGSGTQDVGLGGVTSDTIVLADGVQDVGGEEALNVVSSGGTAYGTQLSGGVQIVEDGSTAYGTIVTSGGVQLVGNQPNTVEPQVDVSVDTLVSSGGEAVAFGLSGTVIYAVGGVNFETVVVSGSTQTTTYGPYDSELDGYSAVLGPELINGIPKLAEV